MKNDLRKGYLYWYISVTCSSYESQEIFFRLSVSVAFTIFIEVSGLLAAVAVRSVVFAAEIRWPAMEYESPIPQGAQNIINISYGNQMCYSWLSRMYLVYFNISWQTTIKSVFVIQLEICIRLWQQFQEWCKTRRTLVICRCLWES